MSKKLLLGLGFGTIAALALVLLFADGADDSPAVAHGGALLPGLADRVNEIAALDIIGADGEIVATLRRERERWRMREQHDYEADFARIHGLLRDLARARRLEPRTDSPKWYARLGVAAPGEGEGSGMAIRFPRSDVPGLIVGQRDPASIGRYVRLLDQSQAWLTDRNLELPVDPMEWLERAIMDIPAADILEVTVRHPGGETVELRPGDAEGNAWVMLDPPAGREVKPGWQLRQTASALAKMNMEDVRPHEAAAVPDNAVETIFRTRDGMVFTARTFSDEAGSWVHFRVSEGEAATDADSAGSASAKESGQDGDAATQREIDIVAVDGRLSPWQFALGQDRFERLRPTTEDLLVVPEEEESQD